LKLLTIASIETTTARPDILLDKAHVSAVVGRTILKRILMEKFYNTKGVHVAYRRAQRQAFVRTVLHNCTSLQK
jgi:hypothetical protein